MSLSREELRAELERFATKDDLERFATKDDLKRFATKDDLKRFATKDDLKRFATKDDLQQFATKRDLDQFRAEVNQRFEDQQRFMMVLIEDLRSDMRALFEGLDVRLPIGLRQVEGGALRARCPACGARVRTHARPSAPVGCG